MVARAGLERRGRFRYDVFPVTARTTGARTRDQARALFRNAILEAAEEVFSDRGFQSSRVHDVATRARIAVGTIYNHFGQKEDVLRALIDARTADMLRAVSASPRDPKTFEARLAARLARLLAYVEQHKKFFALAIEHGLLGGATAAARQMLGKKPIGHVARFRGVLQKLVREGIAEGALAPHDPELLARFLGSALRAITMQMIDGHAPRSDEGAKMIAGLFVRGARAAVRAGGRR
jgi:AcrR family transcriptional regulator